MRTFFKIMFHRKLNIIFRHISIVVFCSSVMKSTSLALGTKVLFILSSLLMCTNALFPFPDNGNIAVCFNMQCFTDMVQFIASKDSVVLAVLTFSLEHDSYNSHYLGNFVDVFTFQTLPVYTVLLQVPEGMTLLETGTKMIEVLPAKKSIFVSYEHGFSSIGLKTIEEFKKSTGHGPQVIYHVNHERPWKRAVADVFNLDAVYNSTEELIASYKLHTLVLRNYYYEPLAPHSHYIPVGVPFYSYLIGSVKYATAYQKPASQRGTYCHFKGRLKYDMVLLQPNASTHEEVLAELPTNPEDNFQYTERQQLFALSAENRLGGCVVEEYDPNVGITNVFYEKYIERLADTAFVLCPSGNNPETFRHYEALELGAIPVFLTPHDDKNFLKSELWSTYPGPVLSNWTELDSFMHSMTHEKADALQATLNTWFTNFKLTSNRKLEALLRDTFEMPPIDTLHPSTTSDSDSGVETSGFNLFDEISIKAAAAQMSGYVGIANTATTGTGTDKVATEQKQKVSDSTYEQQSNVPLSQMESEVVQTLLRAMYKLQTRVEELQSEVSVLQTSMVEIGNKLRLLEAK